MRREIYTAGPGHPVDQGNMITPITVYKKQPHFSFWRETVLQLSFAQFFLPAPHECSALRIF